VTELTCSLHTLDCLQASVRAGRLIVIVARIKDIRRAHLLQEIDADGYMSELKQLWVSVCSMARKKDKSIITELITVYDFGANRIVEISDEGGLQEEMKVFEKAVEGGKAFKGSPAIMETVPVVESGMMFSELFDNFMEYKTDKEAMDLHEGKEPLDEKMQKDYRREFNTLLAILGDSPVSSLTKEKLKVAIHKTGKLPKRTLTKYKNVPVLELLKMNIPDEHRVKSNKPLEMRKLMQGIFAYAVKKKIIEVSPTNGMELKFKASRTFAPYTSEEVRLLLASSLDEKKLWKKWLPTLAAYTGARLGEMAQLRKEDIKFDSDSDRDYIMITEKAGKVKTDNAVRRIPLHPVLKELGFLDFVASVKTVRLFHDLKPKAVTAWFARYRKRLGIEDCDDVGDRKVFHSFRHTFITQSLGAGNLNGHLQQVVGHRKTSEGETSKYTHTFPLREVLAVVDVISYEKL